MCAKSMRPCMNNQESRGIAIVYCPSVCLSVRPCVTFRYRHYRDHIVSLYHRLEFFENNFTANSLDLFNDVTLRHKCASLRACAECVGQKRKLVVVSGFVKAIVLKYRKS